MVDAGLMYTTLLSERPFLRKVFLDALARHPCTIENPWNAIIGLDEYTPGDKLKVNNRRKSMVLSMSFAELEEATLTFDVAWVTTTIVRHTVLLDVVGGWSNVLKLVLMNTFRGTHGLQTVGIPIQEEGQVKAVIFAKMRWIFSDGDGLRAGLEWKGAAGMKPCFRCWNVLSKGSDLITGDADEYVDITCHDVRRFKCWSSDELHTTIDTLMAVRDRVNAGTMPQYRLANLEKTIGYNTNPDSILADVGLRAHMDVFGACLYDWMHSALQNGVVTEEVFLFTTSCGSVGHGSAELEAFVRSDWQFSFSNRAKGQGLYHIFDKFRSRASDKADRLKASASEMLGVYGLIRHWAATIVGDIDAITPQRRSFDAACGVIDIILQAKRGVISANVASGLLVHAICEHMRLHIEAYGVAHVKPKHHWLLDFARQLQDVGLVLDAFIVERLHLRVKRHEHLVKELSVFERSVLAGIFLLLFIYLLFSSVCWSVFAGIVNNQFDEAAKPVSSGLRGTPYLFDGVLVSDHLCVGALRVSTQDIVLRGDQAGIVRLCVDEDGILMVIVKGLLLVDQVTDAT